MPNPRSRILVLLVLALAVAACGTPSGSPDASTGGQAASPDPGSLAPTGPTPSPSACAPLEAPANEGRGHVAPGDRVDYQSYPPTSGDHAVAAAVPGWYDVAPPVEELVHSIEHGFIVAYLPDIDDPLAAELRTRYDALVAEGYGGLIVVPDDAILDPMTLTSWDRLQRCVRIDPDSFEAFVREHYAQAPEANLACGFDGAAALPACEVLLNATPAPTRVPTAADDALLARIPESLRSACRPTTAFASGADAGWDCFASTTFAYGYAGFPNPTARDAFFDSIVGAVDATADSDCDADGASIESFTRADGTSGRLVCTTSGTSRSLYWTIDGSADMGIVVAIDGADVRAFWETAGPAPSP